MFVIVGLESSYKFQIIKSNSQKSVVKARVSSQGAADFNTYPTLVSGDLDVPGIGETEHGLSIIS